ncbi:Alpha/Beta hydrolase protein [Leptodontidium sp. 2 PMI_412]|nr:Alpha/Beta hydrolase protein [Leptodontidium sp. 2 PMI_412]
MSPFPPAPLPHVKRALYFMQAWAVSTIWDWSLFVARLFRPSPLSERPSFSKAYPCRPELRNRVFLPKESTSSSISQPLPLYIDIHGGGFMMGDPESDDNFCSRLADQAKLCVVSINYQKSSKHRFPVPVFDAAAIASAVINDPDLPIDREKVVVGGFSAGGTIALSIVQTPELREKVKAVVAFNPITDWTISSQDKFARAPRRSGHDRLGANFVSLMQWAFVPSGQNLEDPLLSPRYAARDRLPENVWIIAAEEDILCGEAEDMALGLAGSDSGKLLRGKASWEKHGVRWEKMLGWKHGFHHIREKGEKERERQQVMDDLVHRIGLWLQERCFV